MSPPGKSGVESNSDLLDEISLYVCGRSVEGTGREWLEQPADTATVQQYWDSALYCVAL